jgi:dTMP kinase
MDIGLSGDLYESFVQYQTRLLDEFDRMVAEFDFTVIDASPSIKRVNQNLKKAIGDFLSLAQP